MNHKTILEVPKTIAFLQTKNKENQIITLAV